MRMHLVVALVLVLLTPSAVDVGASWVQENGGSRIAFTRLREDVNRPGSHFQFEAEIWMMNGDGSEPTRLTYNATDDLGATWSPNGRTIAFYGTPFGPDAEGEPVAIGPPNVFLIDMASRSQQLLTPMRGRWPSWSPDGHRIAFDNGGPAGGDIFVINVDGTGLQQLTDDFASRNIRPDWSPDGREIAFTSRRDGNDEIYVMNADGSNRDNPLRLTFNLFADNAPDWSPDGRRIVFQSNRAGNDEIYVMNADGSGGLRRLTTYPGRDLDADWSPDGRTIAFERDLEPIAARIIQVFVIDADTPDAEAVPLTMLPSENGHPGWGHGRAVRQVR